MLPVNLVRDEAAEPRMGGFGIVTRYCDSESGGLVAVKIPRDSGDVSQIEALRSEIRVYERLAGCSRVPDLVACRDAAEDPWLAVQWIDGETLGDGPFSALPLCL